MKINKNTSMCKLLSFLGVYWKTIIVIVTPFVLLPLHLCMNRPEASCAYALVLMAVYWITDAIPIPVTALLPLVLFPLMGLVPGNVIAGKYITGSSVTFLGGVMMALALEESQLHRRLALRLLITVGSKPSSIALGFILPTWFLSLWISNTAATAMLLPVVESVIERLRESLRLAHENKKKNLEPNVKDSHVVELYPEQITRFGAMNECTTISTVSETVEPKSAKSSSSSSSLSSSSSSPPSYKSSSFREASEKESVESDAKNTEQDCEDDSADKDERQLKQFSAMLCLIIAYSANIGGTATLTGTPTNIIVAEMANQVFESHGQPAPLSYATWLMYGLPNSLLCLLLMWLWLQLYFMSYRSFCCCCSRYNTGGGEDVGIGEMVKKEYDQLGSITFYEISATVFLVLMVLLWFARDPGFSPGYGTMFKSGFVNDGVPAMLIAILLFVFPSQLPNFFCGKGKMASGPALLDWHTVSTRLPWGPVILVGGGQALAYGCRVSGLPDWLGLQMRVLQTLPAWSTVLILATMVSFLTEITSNSAVINVLSPILVAVAAELNLNPLYLLLPSGLAASCAFMLPVATPPNAIIFAAGHLKIFQMVKAGFVLNMLCIVVITVGVHTWGMGVFHLNSLPWDSVTLNNTNTSVAVLNVPTH